MSGWSRSWGGRFVVWGALASIVSVLGCSRLPLPPTDDAGAPDTLAPATIGPRPLTPIPVDAIALGADDSGIYWTSSTNELWTLPPQLPVPVRLASAPAVTMSCGGTNRLLLTPAFAFWMSGDRATLHRTRKDGSDDVRFAAVAGGDNLASDGDAVYWTERSGGYAGGYVDGSVIRSLPADAEPGSPPTTLLLSFDQIFSLAVVAGNAYWTPAPNATVYYSDIWTGPVAALAGGSLGSKLAGLNNPYGLMVAGGAIYFAFHQDLWTSGLASLATGDVEQSLAVLPTSEYAVGLATTTDWILASAYGDGSGCGEIPALHLWATPRAGGTPKLIAQGLRAPAVTAPQGIVYVDASKRLMALPTDQVGRIVSPIP